METIVEGVQELIEYSREIGANPEWVIAGGGNTSWKNGREMQIKASGARLASIDAEGLVKMDLDALDRIWSTEYPADVAAREKQALADLMAARLPGEEKKRPSVETLMHALISPRFVVHTHPSIVNGITCSARGADAAREVLGEDVLWVPTVNPGYVLASTIRSAIQAFNAARGAEPRVILLQNHGLVVADDSIDAIRAAHARIVARIRHHLKREPDFTPVAVRKETVDACRDAIRAAIPAMNEVVFVANRELLRLAASVRAMDPISSAFSPDHIVYAGVAPCFAGGSGGVADAVSTYRTHLSVDPKVMVVAGTGAFALGANRVAAEAARDLLIDAIKISVFAESFGGHRFLPADQIEFIRNWEVEAYRTRKSAG